MKPSWTDITAFGLLLLFALVMAHGWPSGDWSLGWTALSALGGAAAAAGAFYAARVALSTSTKADDRYQNVILLDAREHFLLLKFRLHAWLVQLNNPTGKISLNPIKVGKMSFDRNSIQLVFEEMQATVDLKKLYYLDPLLMKCFSDIYGVFYQVTTPFNSRDSEQLKRDSEGLEVALTLFGLAYRAAISFSEDQPEWLAELKGCAISKD